MSEEEIICPSCCAPIHMKIKQHKPVTDEPTEADIQDIAFCLQSRGLTLSRELAQEIWYAAHGVEKTALETREDEPRKVRFFEYCDRKITGDCNCSCMNRVTDEQCEKVARLYLDGIWTLLTDDQQDVQRNAIRSALGVGNDGME